MIIERIQVKDYKSISELNWVLNDEISCLVGQNESGKSNLLELFEYLKPTIANSLNYEIHTTRSSDRYDNQKIPFIKFIFQFTETSRNKFLEVLNKSKIDIKPYGDIKNLKSFIIEINEDEANNQFYYLIWNNKQVLIKTFMTETSNVRVSQGQNIVNKRSVPINPNVISAVTISVEELLPNIIRLKEEDFTITYSNTVAELVDGSHKNSSLYKLLKIAGLNDSAKIPKGKPQLRQYLKRLNKNLDKNFVKKYYSQDSSVRLEFVHDSGTISLDIEDSTEGAYIMEERSDGFKYFFGLIIEMASNFNNDNQTLFILDEPGSKLHPSGQRDLLKYLEDLSETNNIIYTTHSPFLINRLYPNRVKIVERDIENGTIFKYKGFSKNWKPMRSSLGLNIKDSFYYSDKALIVEGPEDLIFISSLIDYFNKNGDLDLNTDLFSFIDAGGESNLPSMVQIIMDDDRPTLVLIDSDSQSTFNKLTKKVKSVNDNSVLDLIQVNEFNKDAVSIEDLLPYQLLQAAVKLFCAELEADGVFEKKKAPNGTINATTIASAVLATVADATASLAVMPINLSKVNSSRYNTSISKAVKDFYKEVDLDEEKWSNKKTPISKVGMARHFEILLQNDKIDKSKMDFKPSLKLVKTIATKLGLLS